MHCSVGMACDDCCPKIGNSIWDLKIAKFDRSHSTPPIRKHGYANAVVVLRMLKSSVLSLPDRLQTELKINF